MEFYKKQKAARALLEWKQEELAKRSGVSLPAIRSIELANNNPTMTTQQKILTAFEQENVFFTPNGVEQIQEYIKRFKGSDGYKKFMDLAYEEAKANGGDFCIYNSSPSKWAVFADDEWNNAHVERMSKISDKINFRIMCPYGEKGLIARPYATHKWIPKEQWTARSFYVFGNNTAILIFENDTIEIILLQEEAIAETFRDLFDISWETTAITPDE